MYDFIEYGKALGGKIRDEGILRLSEQFGDQKRFQASAPVIQV
jgi:hypothetical protein